MSRPAPAVVRLAAAVAVISAVTVVAPVIVAAAPPARPAAAAVLPPNDFCLQDCSDILPPGQNGNATLAEILAHRALGTRPAHTGDQLDRYARLVYGYAGLAEDQVDAYFNDASFGVPAGQVERRYQPRSDVTVVRDRATGTPHVTGTTRAGTMYGAGYAGAEDRLFTMDLLRHVGRGTLTAFAGGAPGNRDLEQSVWRNSPYTEADLQAQVTALRQRGPRGEQLHADVLSYIAGVNAYIAACMRNRNCPGEYVLTGHLDAITNAGGPVPFTVTDVIAIAGVVGGLFGGGGGGEMQSALVRIAARARYGTAEGDAVWAAFRQQNDPETVLTLHNGQSFPYGGGSADAPSVALPDRGSATVEPVVTDRTGSAGTTSGGRSDIAAALGGLTIGPAGRGMSNAVVISAEHSATGHPIAVFGPQTGYFSPQLLMVQELQGPGISARGVAFAGLNLYVLLGRGQDYAWSATSSTHDITDTYAVPLCTVDGTAPTLASNRYLFRGQCLAMEELSHVNAWRPTLADSTPAGSYRLVAWRTRLGLVAWRGTVGGRPHAFTHLRSTYRHEADSAIGFQMFNDPAAMGTAGAFVTAAATIGYAFNWFYVNATQVGYFNSGLNPVRAAGSNPNLPMKAEPAYEWPGFNPDDNTATYTTAAQHPHSTGQDYFISWNNKQATDFAAADGNFSFGAVHRGDLLDKPARAAVQAGRKFDRAGVVSLVERAAVTDLRGVEVLDHLLRVLTSQPVTEPALATAIDRLRTWRQAGAPRQETTAGSKVYQHAEAIRIFDAWWPLLVRGQFRAGLGADLYQALVNTLQVNESPSGQQPGDGSSLPAGGTPTHKGSSFQYGWWGYVSKDLRAVLGDPVAGGLGRPYCGNGSLAGCRGMLLDTLRTAAGQPATAVYPGDDHCAAGDQWCADAILQSPLGGITHPLTAWQNRPTYQQVVSFPAARGQDIANLAQGRAVTASSTQLGHPARNAVDGSPTSRWSSGFSDNQSITVDLGANRSIRRTVLRWEAAYASAYRIEVSTDGTTWTAVWSTAAGNGGTDVNVFAPTTARYVRMSGVRRATPYGYSLWEMEVYAH